MSAPIYPLNITIIKLCEKQIDKNFAKKGNSWIDGQQTPQGFLENKLQEEYSEFVLALQKHDGHAIANEGADLINIISMLMNRYGSTESKTRIFNQNKIDDATSLVESRQSRGQSR